MQLYQRQDILQLRQRSQLPGTLRWVGADQPNLWQWNLKRNPGISELYPNIEYRLNSQGFRSPEFHDIDFSESVVLLGCSMVFGEGLAEHHCLAEQISLRISRPVINLGISGASAELIRANNLMLWSAGHRPKLVINIWPTADRVTAYTDRGVLCMGVWSVSDQAQEQEIHRQRLAEPTLYGTAEELTRWQTVYQAVNHTDLHQNTLLTQSSLTVRALWGSQSKEYTWAPSSAAVLGCDLLPRLGRDLARDQRHPGAETHQQWAAQIVRDIGDLL